MTVKFCHTVRRARKSDASKAELSKNEIADLLSIIESVPTQDTSVFDPFLNKEKPNTKIKKKKQKNRRHGKKKHAKCKKDFLLSGVTCRKPLAR